MHDDIFDMFESDSFKSDAEKIKNISNSIRSNTDAMRNIYATSIDGLSRIISEEDRSDLNDLFAFVAKRFYTGALAVDHYNKDVLSEEEYEDFCKTSGMTIKQMLFLEMIEAEFVLNNQRKSGVD